MEHESTTAFMTTNPTEFNQNSEPSDTKSWLDFVLPIMASGFFLLLIISFFGYFVEFFKTSKCCSCFRRQNRSTTSTTRTRNTGTDNSDFEANGEDLPPSYSVSRFGRSGFEVFQVVTEDDSDIITQWPTTDVGDFEKLPSYFEIMEAKKREAERSSSTNRTNDSQNEVTVVSQAEITSPLHTPIEVDGDTESTSNIHPPSYSSVSSEEPEHANS